MTDTPLPCQTCGALLVQDRQGTDAAGNAVWYWHCENGHYWRQTAVVGWEAIDAGDVPVEVTTIVRETE